MWFFWAKFALSARRARPGQYVFVVLLWWGGSAPGNCMHQPQPVSHITPGSLVMTRGSNVHPIYQGCW
jgi:hypothetical protein